MHSLGNDFVIINAIHQTILPTQLPITLLADRHRGIGFDQLLIIELSKHADFYCRIFNADGSEAEQCGNGLRCVARFIHEEKLCAQSSFQIETRAGMFPITIHDDDHISMTLTAPIIQEASVELNIKQSRYKLILDVLSLGNPHAIIKVASLETITVGQLGLEIISHPHFSQGINIGFLQIRDNHHMELRTYERGVGETHACGSNACAAVFAGIVNGWVRSPVTVQFRYGCVSIEYDDEKKLIRMTGPASRVFEGEINSCGSH